MSRDSLSSKQAADLLGASVTSIKRWADEGLLPCVKTLGKHRRFERQLIEQRRFRQIGTNAPVSNVLPNSPSSIVDLLLHSDVSHEVEARLLVMRGELGSFWRVAEQVGEVLTELGLLWQRGHITVTEEHVASERLARAIARVGEWIPVPLDAPRAFLVPAEGEEHTIGLNLVELCLRELSWQVVWGGRYTPLMEIARTMATNKYSVRLLAVSASSVASNAKQLAYQANVLGSVCKKAEIVLVLGGNGCWPEHPVDGIRIRSFSGFHDLVTNLST